MTSRAQISIAALLVLSFLTSCNLAGDVTPPPAGPQGSGRPAAGPPTEVPASLAPPSSRPSVTAGASIYDARCAACHGQLGLGDGPQAAELPAAPSPLGDAETAREITPREWFEVVTRGRMDRFMPPFSSLTAQQRWDVVAYALALSAPSDGQTAELYREYCAECHGPQGEGSERGPSLVQPEEFARRSRADLAAVIRQGIEGTMPGFEEQLEGPEIRRLAAYVQGLTVVGDQPTALTEGDEELQSAPEGVGKISGRVLDGSSQEPISEPISVTLHAFDGQQQVLTEQAEPGEDGEFTFSGLEIVPGRLYVVSADYQGIRYISDVVHLSGDQGPTELNLSVYETTTDPSAVVARRVHVLMDRPTEGAVRVVEMWIFVNEGGRTVAPENGEGGVEVALPVRARDLRFEDSLLAERYQPTELGFRLTTPLRPGGEGAQVVFSFNLPLGDFPELVQPLTVPVDAVTVLVVEGGPAVTGTGVQNVGEREAGGERFEQYSLGSLPAGDALRLELEGPPWWQKLLPRSLDAGWAVGAAALVIALAAVTWWYRPWIASREATPEEAEGQRTGRRRRSLLEAIAELDDTFERGEVEEAVYRQRRNELKAELMQLMEGSND